METVQDSVVAPIHRQSLRKGFPGCPPEGRASAGFGAEPGPPEALVRPAEPPSRAQHTGQTYSRVWRAARRGGLTDAQQPSPLARRPYDLRHAAVSLWLNEGVPATQVAEWAGHSVHVLLKVYAKCIEGQDAVARRRIEGALNRADDEAASPSRNS